MRSRGFTLLEILVIVAILAIVSSIAIASFLGARIQANETSVISAMRSLVSSQVEYYLMTTDGSGQRVYASTLQQLVDRNLLDSAVGSGTKAGYLLTLSSSDVHFSWSAYAEPINRGVTGRKTFWVDQQGVVRFSVEGIANQTSQAVAQ